MSRTYRTVLMLALACALLLAAQTEVEPSSQVHSTAGWVMPTAPQGWEVFMAIRR